MAAFFSGKNRAPIVQLYVFLLRLVPTLKPGKESEARTNYRAASYEHRTIVSENHQKSLGSYNRQITEIARIAIPRVRDFRGPRNFFCVCFSRHGNIWSLSATTSFALSSFSSVRLYSHFKCKKYDMVQLPRTAFICLNVSMSRYVKTKTM